MFVLKMSPQSYKPLQTLLELIKQVGYQEQKRIIAQFKLQEIVPAGLWLLLIQTLT